MDKQLNARISPDTYKRVKSAQADSKLTLNTLVEQLLEIGLAHLKGNVATDSNSYVSQSDFESFRGEMLGKLQSLTELLSQVESIAPVQVAENKGVGIENHPKTLTKPLQVAKIALTGGKVKTITYDTNPDGSVKIKSIRGVRAGTLKTLSDDELVSIGIFRSGDKFYRLNDLKLNRSNT